MNPCKQQLGIEGCLEEGMRGSGEGVGDTRG